MYLIHPCACNIAQCHSLGHYMPRNVGTMTVNVLDGVMENDLNSALFTGKVWKFRPGVGWVAGYHCPAWLPAVSHQCMTGLRTPSCRLKLVG